MQHDREQAAVLLLTGQMAFLAAAAALLYVTANALFLAEYGADKLPYVYLGYGIAVPIIFFRLAALQRRLALASFVLVCFAIEGILYLLAWLVLVLYHARWVAFGLMLLAPLALLVLGIVLGGQAGQLFDVRQMKRVWPRIYGGAASGYIIASLAAPYVVLWLGTPHHLLLLAVVALLVTALFLLMLRRRFPGALAHRARTERVRPASASQLLKRPLTVNLLSYQMLSAIGTQLAIFILLAQADARFTDPAELTQFFGNLGGWRNILNMLFLLFAASYLLRRFGLRFGLTANPIIVGSLVAAMAIVALFSAPTALLFFWLAILTHILDNLLTDGVTTTALKTVYQTIPPADRGAVETLVEGIGVPIAFGLTGVLLLLFEAVPALSLTSVVLFTVGVCVVWTLLGQRAYRGYSDALLQTLKRSALAENDLSLDDPATLAAVERLAGSEQLSEVQLGLKLLARQEHPALGGHLLRLLDQPQPLLQREALALVEARRVRAALPALQRLVAPGVADSVRGAALRALAALQEDEAVPLLTRHLDSPDSATRRGAMVGLLHYGGIPGVLAAGNRLLALAASPDPAEREFVARVTGAVGRRGFYHPLSALLADPEPAVRRAALDAAARVRHPALLPQIAPNLATPDTRSAAVRALVASGDAIVPLLRQALAASQDAEQGPTLPLLLQVARQIKGPLIQDTLLPHLGHPTREIRTRVLEALVACRHSPGQPVLPDYEPVLRDEVEQSVDGLSFLQSLPGDAAFAPLRRALQQRIQQAHHRIFLLLALRYDHDAMLRAETLLARAAGPRQALAFELVEISLSPAHGALLLPLLHPRLEPEERLRRLSAHLSIPSVPLSERLRELLHRPAHSALGAWTRATAIYGIARGCDPEQGTWVEPLLTTLQGDSNPIVRESAQWALRQHAARPEQPGERGNMLTIEKVAVLNQVELFREVPDHLLAALAGIVEEVALASDSTFIRQGETEETMYLIIEGRVRVHRDGHTLIELPAGSTVGELAVLDPEERSASVTTTSDSTLLRIEREPFEEIMATHPEMAHGVIRALTRRIREQASFVAR